MIYKRIQAGFTLIELMVVTAIISILAIVAISSYQRYVSQAQLNACLLEVKSYSNHVFYMINDQDASTLPIALMPSACESITNALGWTLDTQQKIIAVAKLPSNARIDCDIPNGSPCRLLP